MLNDGLKDYYENLALEAVIQFAAEQGVRLRRGDFWLFDDQQDRRDFMECRGEYKNAKKGYWDYQASNHVDGVYTQANGKVNGIVYVYIFFAAGKAASRLKDKTRNFLNYRFAIVDKEKIQFSFTLNDLDIIAAQNDRGGENEDGFNKEKIIEKINKLLNMTRENNASEGEAIAASTMVQKLLSKYHLSMADVKGESYEEEITQVTAVVDKGSKWKYQLAGVVANGYACKCYFVGASNIIFYGYETDILAARRVYTYLFNVGNRLSRLYVKERRETQERTEGVANAFLAGFINGIEGEFDKQCTALALVVQPKVKESFEDFSKGWKFKNCSINTGRRTDMTAYRDGEVEGRRALNGRYLDSPDNH